MELNLGINSEDRHKIATGLASLLADSYSLYLKTHNYHWNVEGPPFNTLHEMFAVQYTELAAEEMVRQLAIGQESVVRTARSVFPVANSANDEPTADLLTQRMQTHEKNAWMLRSMLA